MNRSFKIAKMTTAAALLGIGLWTGSAQATLVTLKESNSQVNLDTASDAGMFDWLVDSVDQIKKQWFWYRTGNGDFESPINSLFQQSVVTSKVPLFSPSPDPNRVKVTYTDAANVANSTFQIDVTITLLGGNPGDHTSTISEDIRIKNLSNAPLDFHFYQYTDFDVLGTAAGDTINLVNPGFNTARQSEGIGNISDEVVTPAPDHFEVGEAAAILAKLNNLSVDLLNDSTGPLVPNDAAWAYQWDRSLAAAGNPGNTLQISLKKTVSFTENPPIPEPTTAGLMGLMGLALLRRSRR